MLSTRLSDSAAIVSKESSQHNFFGNHLGRSNTKAKALGFQNLAAEITKCSIQFFFKSVRQACLEPRGNNYEAKHMLNNIQ